MANDRRRFFEDWPFFCADERTELFACQRDGLTINDLSGLESNGPWTHSFTPGWGDPSSDPIGDIRKAMDHYKRLPGPVANYTVARDGKTIMSSDQTDALRYATLYHASLGTPDRKTTIIT